MHRVQDSTLKELGIHPGDVIRLKDGAAAWWNGPDAKRKRPNDDDTEHRKQSPTPSAQHNSVTYKTRYDEGGGCQFLGPPMVSSDSSLCPGESLWYKCEARNDWFPVPAGYTIVHEGDEDPFAV
jgi:hypothetical protein